MSETMFFKAVKGAAVLLQRDGVFKEAKLYTLDGRAYAALPSGFIGLFYNNGLTTVPSVKWVGVSGAVLVKGKLGRAYVSPQDENPLDGDCGA